MKLFGLIILILLGAFIFLYGGYDDSPGAQGLGVMAVAIGVVGILRLIKNRNK